MVYLVYPVLLALLAPAYLDSLDPKDSRDHWVLLDSQVKPSPTVISVQTLGRPSALQYVHQQGPVA